LLLAKFHTLAFGFLEFVGGFGEVCLDREGGRWGGEGGEGGEGGGEHGAAGGGGFTIDTDGEEGGVRLGSDGDTIASGQWGEGHCWNGG